MKQRRRINSIDTAIDFDKTQLIDKILTDKASLSFLADRTQAKTELGSDTS